MKDRAKNPTEIRVWMLRKGIRQKHVADLLGISLNAVHLWINGQRTSKKIANYFRQAGCPEVANART